MKVIHFFWKLPCSTPIRILKPYTKLQEYFLLPLLPSCDIKTNELFTGFGFSERTKGLQLLVCINTFRAKVWKPIDIGNVKFISVTTLKSANYRTTFVCYVELRNLDVNFHHKKTRYNTSTIISFKLHFHPSLTKTYQLFTDKNVPKEF